MLSKTIHYLLRSLCVLSLALVGCAGDSDDEALFSYELDDDSTVGTTYQVVIDIFGDGSVNLDSQLQPQISANATHGSSVSAMNTAHDAFTCIDEICEGSFEEGETIIILASSDPDWAFSNWSGCDVVTDNACEIKLSSDRELFLTFSSDKPLEVASDLIYLSEEQMRAIVDYDVDSEVIQFASGADISNISVGDIIISTGIYTNANSSDNVEIYFAKRVVDINALTGSSTFIETVGASLDEFILDGVLTYNSNSELASSSTNYAPLIYNPITPSSLTVSEPSINFVVYDKDGNDATIHDQVIITGDLSATFDPDVGIDFSILKGLKYFRLVGDTKISGKLGLKYGGEAFSFPEKKPTLITKTFPPFVVGPVIFVPKIDLYLSAVASFDASINPTVTIDITTTPWVKYSNDGSGWSSSGNFESNTRFTSLEDSITVKGSAELGAGIVGSIMVYGVAGPKLDAGPYIGAEFYPILENSNCFFDYNTYYGLEGIIGGDFKLFSKRMRYEITLFNLKNFITQGNNCTNSGSASEPPTTPSSLTVAALDGNALSLGWEASTDDGFVKNYYVSRIANNKSTSVAKPSGTYYIDEDLSPSTEYCYQVAAIDNNNKKSEYSRVECQYTHAEYDVELPSEPTNLVASTNSSSSIDLSWDASYDASGVEGYVIFDESSTYVEPYIVEEVSGQDNTSVGIYSLNQGTQYCYSVAAVDIFGNMSTRSSISCAQTKDGSEAEWTIYMGCQGADYNIEDSIDLDLDTSGEIPYVINKGEDYDGSALAYHITGYYFASEGNIDGAISWTFENSSSVRKDEFLAHIGSGDSGDVNMDQVVVTGCDGKIRFVRKDVMASEASPVLNVDIPVTNSKLMFNNK